MADVQTIPILASLDLAETEAFYREAMGFDDAANYGDYLLLKHGEFELHFWLTTDRSVCEATACYIRGGGVPALFEAFKDRPFGKGRLSAFEVRPWNMREFHVHDPHGNLLRFGCAPEECPE